MEWEATRRQFLRAGGAASALALAGCLGGSNPISGGGGGESAPSGWPRVQRDAAATGRAGGSGPTSAVEEVWTASTNNSRAPTPVVVDGTVYAETPGSVSAFDAETGDEEWSRGFEDSPAYLTVWDGTLYFEAGGMRALDVADGSEVWTYDAVPEKGCSTVVGGRAYVGKATGGLVALDAANGEESWSFPTDQPVRAPPAVANGTVYVVTPTRDGEQGALYAVDAESGEEVWRVGTGSAFVQTPTVADGSVYLQEEYVTARSTDTGDEEWTYEHDTAIVPRTVAYADGTVYFGNKRPQSVRGTVFALDAGSGEQNWERSFEGGAVDGPIISDGALYVGTTEGVIHALDADSGETLWDHSVGSSIDTGLALADGRLYAVSDDATLHVLAEA